MTKRYRNKFIIYLGGTLPKGIYKLTKLYCTDNIITITIYQNDDRKQRSETIRMEGGSLALLESRMIKKKDLGNYLEYMI